MVAERIEEALRAKERTWAWLGRQIGIKGYRMWRLRRGEVPWRHQEALAACATLEIPYVALFGSGQDVLPPGRERRAPPPPRAPGPSRHAPAAVAS